jgi:hypothetical protein
MRPHYLPEELDRLFEKVLADFFRPSHGSTPYPIPTDDLTRLIERDACDFDPGADLSHYGPNVEGVTEFAPTGKPRVRVTATLSYDEARENRYRTTLTHEYGHVHLHSYLFQMAASDNKSPGRANPQGQICKRETIITAGVSDWIEWQAGYACGAMLMPISAVRRLADACADSHKLVAATGFSGSARAAMIEQVVRTFQVSEQAAVVRLSQLAIIVD